MGLPERAASKLSVSRRERNYKSGDRAEDYAQIRDSRGLGASVRRESRGDLTVYEFRYTASLATSDVGKNPPDWCDQSDA